MKKLLLLLVFSCLFMFQAQAVERTQSSMLATMAGSSHSSQTKEGSGGGGGGLFIIIIAAAAVFGYMAYNRNKKLNLVKSGFMSQPDFVSNQMFISEKIQTAIAVDETAQNICVYKKDIKKNDTFRVIESRDIMSVEIVEDGDSITETSRTSQIGGALVGGVLLGGLGTLLGGLSGKKKTSTQVRTILLRISVNDLSNSYYDVVMSDEKLLKSSKKYKTVMAKAIDWYNIVSILIKRFNDSQNIDISEPIASSSMASSSIADELNKLNELKEKGILTTEEFETQNEEYLAKSPDRQVGIDK